MSRVTGGVVRAIVDPPVHFPWSVVFRRGSDVERGTAALLDAARATSRAGRWLDRAPHASLPLPERTIDRS